VTLAFQAVAWEAVKGGAGRRHPIAPDAPDEATDLLPRLRDPVVPLVCGCHGAFLWSARRLPRTCQGRSRRRAEPPLLAGWRGGESGAV